MEALLTRGDRRLTDIQLIELWETYLLQLDSEEDGPPILPAGVVADAEQDRRATTQAGGEAHAEDDQQSLSGTTVRDSEDVPRSSEDTAHDEPSDAAAHEDDS